MIEIKVYTIQVELPRWARRVPAVVAGLLVTGLCATVSADVTLPTTFADGKQLTADQLNGNFTALANAVNALQKGPNVCGFTDPTTGNILGDASTTGYVAAAGLCQKVAGCGTSSHMCLAHEIVGFLSHGGTMPPLPPSGAHQTAWYSTGIRFYLPGGVASDDCTGFTTAAQGANGPSWDLNLSPKIGQPDFDSCTDTIPIMCCD